ncbi:hypothetical protein INR49_003971 [Caranx melampygus]|nr:hypothetical protein INR49_003971 [Caranx melampygus]
MRGERERVKERLMRKGEQRQMARSQLAKLPPPPRAEGGAHQQQENRKSSCGNTILSREIFHTDTHTTYCAEARGKVSGRTVTVLDTPERCPQGGAGETAGGRRPDGGGALVLFSYGDWLGDTSIEQRIESEGAPLQRLVDRCGNRYHVLDNKRRGDEAQVAELVELVEEMLAREGWQTFTEETTCGEVSLQLPVTRLN